MNLEDRLKWFTYKNTTQVSLPVKPDGFLRHGIATIIQRGCGYHTIVLRYVKVYKDDFLWADVYEEPKQKKLKTLLPI